MTDFATTVQQHIDNHDVQNDIDFPDLQNDGGYDCGQLPVMFTQFDTGSDDDWLRASPLLFKRTSTRHSWRPKMTLISLTFKMTMATMTATVVPAIAWFDNIDWPVGSTSGDVQEILHWFRWLTCWFRWRLKWRWLRWRPRRLRTGVGVCVGF